MPIKYVKEAIKKEVQLDWYSATTYWDDACYAAVTDRARDYFASRYTLAHTEFLKELD